MEQTLLVESTLAEASKVAGVLGYHQLGLLVILNVETVEIPTLSQSVRGSQPRVSLARTRKY